MLPCARVVEYSHKVAPKRLPTDHVFQQNDQKSIHVLEKHFLQRIATVWTFGDCPHTPLLRNSPLPRLREWSTLFWEEDELVVSLVSLAVIAGVGQAPHGPMPRRQRDQGCDG